MTLNSMPDSAYVQCPFNPNRYTASLSLDADWLLEVLMVVHFIFFRTFLFFHIVVNNPFIITCDHFILKMVDFCCIQAEDHRWKCTLLNLFLLNSKAPKYYSDAYIQVFSNALHCSYEISGVFLHFPLSCYLYYF